MTAPSAEATDPRRAPPLRAFVVYFLRLGAIGFGGPIALAARMHADLVDARGWIAKSDYDEGLALAQLSPGPLAAQLAIYLGWVRARALGAALVGGAFVLPSFAMVLAIAALYVRFGEIPLLQGAFYGIGAAVIAIIAKSAQKLLQKSLRRDLLLWGVAAVNAAVTAWTASELVALVLASGVVVVFARRPPATVSGALVWPAVPSALAAGVHGPASAATIGKLLVYFASAGLFVFGSGLAIVPFLHGGVVDEHRWLTEQQFVDAVAVAMITPGPVVISVAFIGYLVAGALGASAAAIGVFFPCFAIVVLVAPHYRELAGRPRVKAFVEGVTAGAVGAIAGATIVLARRSIVDAPTIAVALATLAALTFAKKVPEPVWVLAAGVLGVAIRATRGG